MAKIKVLVIEDNRLLRDGTAALLNEQLDISAVGSGGNAGAIEKVRTLRPDVVLLDLGLRSLRSLKVLETIKKRFSKVEIVIMDLIPSQQDVAELTRIGVSGYVPQNATLDDFLRTIRMVAKGKKIPPPVVADSLFTKVVNNAIKKGSVTRVINSVKLNRPEQAVLSQLADGKSIIETSRNLNLEFFAVKGHIRNVMDKLALHTRLELTAFARTQEQFTRRAGHKAIQPL
jgi:DNA-binding NarL/FixJ family response regulator